MSLISVIMIRLIATQAAAALHVRLCMPLQVIGWEKIELISARPLETMLDEFKRLKAEYPGRHAPCELHHTLQCCLEGHFPEIPAVAEAVCYGLNKGTVLIRQIG